MMFIKQIAIGETKCEYKVILSLTQIGGKIEGIREKLNTEIPSVDLYATGRKPTAKNKSGGIALTVRKGCACPNRSSEEDKSVLVEILEVHSFLACIQEEISRIAPDAGLIRRPLALGIHTEVTKQVDRLDLGIKGQTVAKCFASPAVKRIIDLLSLHIIDGEDHLILSRFDKRKDVHAQKARIDAIVGFKVNRRSVDLDRHVFDGLCNKAETTWNGFHLEGEAQIDPSLKALAQKLVPNTAPGIQFTEFSTI